MATEHSGVLCRPIPKPPQWICRLDAARADEDEDSDIFHFSPIRTSAAEQAKPSKRNHSSNPGRIVRGQAARLPARAEESTLHGTFGEMSQNRLSRYVDK
jgi:hypothetical protein